MADVVEDLTLSISGGTQRRTVRAVVSLITRCLHETQLITVWIRDGHVAEAQVVVWAFGHPSPALQKLPVPGL